PPAPSRRPRPQAGAGRDGRGDLAPHARLQQSAEADRGSRGPHAGARARPPRPAAGSGGGMAGDQPPGGRKPTPVSGIAGEDRPAPPIDLSIRIPVSNEEENLPILWPEIREVLDPTNLHYEVMFVDDGSRDGSAEIVCGFHDQDPRARLVRLKANAGETAATDAGFKSVRGKWVVVMDADLQND